MSENDIKNLQTGITYVKNMRLNRKELEELETEIKDLGEKIRKLNLENEKSFVIIIHKPPIKLRSRIILLLLVSY